MKKIIPISFAAILAVVFVASVFVLLFTCYIQQTVAYGVTFCSLPLEGKTLDNAREQVMEATQGVLQQEVTVSYSNVEIAFSLKELDAKIAWDEGVIECYQLGKTGNVFLRSKEIIVARLLGTDITPHITYNQDKLTKLLEPLQNKIKTPVKEASSKLEEDHILVTAGEKGEVFDREQLMKDILTVLVNQTETKIPMTTQKRNPEQVLVEDLATQYTKEPVNARYVTENGEISIIPDEDGISFDKKAAQELLRKKQHSYTIPLIRIKANVTYADLDTNIFNDTLATYTTSYGSGDSGRNYNVELAAERLNNLILEAGDSFSFVELIGDGSEARGFRSANVYSRGEVKQETGGGVCQVASTLYSAVLYANLEVTSRTAHQLPVAFIPAGQDATISSDGIDFRFKNNQLFPIRILTNTNGGTLTVTIQGTNANPGQTVNISNSVIETLPYPSKTVMSDQLEPGIQEVIQNGKDGCVVNTYRMITANGATIQSDIVATSRYEPIPKVIREGVEKKTEETQTQPEE